MSDDNKTHAFLDLFQAEIDDMLYGMYVKSTQQLFGPQLPVLSREMFFVRRALLHDVEEELKAWQSSLRGRIAWRIRPLRRRRVDKHLADIRRICLAFDAALPPPALPTHEYRGIQSLIDNPDNP